jgi:cytoskeletal protein CcmA (bactofilin family)
MRRTLALFLAVVLVGTLFTGIAAADTRAGGTVVIEEGEQVNGLSATASTVVISGTVNGDLRAYGSDVVITETGNVTGTVRIYASSATINGTVEDNVLVYGGTVTVGESAYIDNSFGAIAGDVTLGGEFDSNVNVFAGTVNLERSATIGGDLTYEGTLNDRGGTVEGVTQRTQELALIPPLGPLRIVFSIFMFFASLFLGSILLYLGPRFADAVYETCAAEPLRTAGAGLAAVGGVALAIVLFAITIIGLPIAVAILLVTVVLAWIAVIYGRYVVGTWLLSYTSRDNRYLALFVGVLVIGLLGLIPYLGFLIKTAVFLLGAGVVALAIRQLFETVSASRGGLADI